MLVALIARDKANGLEIRLENREAHIDYLQRSQNVAQAGPLLDQDEKMIGSLIILDVDDMQEAEDWSADDPYNKAGLFESVDLIVWKKVI